MAHFVSAIDTTPRNSEKRLAAYCQYCRKNFNGSNGSATSRAWEKSAASIGSNGSTPSGDFSEIEATMHQLWMHAATMMATGRRCLSDLSEYPPERWPCLIDPFNVEAAEYEAHPTPKIRDEGLRGASKMMDDNLSVFGKIVEIVRPLLHQ